jgi:hypothetical protein
MSPLAGKISPKAQEDNKKEKRMKVGNDSDIEITDNIESELHHEMNEVSCLDFLEDGAPLDLSWFADGLSISSDPNQSGPFAASIDWPFQLTIKGIFYMLFV